MVREELGADVSELFASFEREPFGSASIGQVHDAVLPDGRRVAVKVQRPGIGALMICDVALMRRAAAIVDRTRVLGATRTRDVVDELDRWTREELDYTVEAANAIEIRANIRHEDTGYAPEIHTDHSARRVLTAERLDGTPLVDIIRELRADREATVRRLRAAGHDLDEVAANVVWNFLDQVYAIGVFHGDLHPANVLLLDGNRVGYVDFGIVGRLSPEVQQSLGDYARSLFGGNPQAAVDQLLRWLRPSPRTRLADARADMLRLTEQFLGEAEDARPHAPARAARALSDRPAGRRAHAPPVGRPADRPVHEGRAGDGCRDDGARAVAGPAVGARALLLRAHRRGPAERLLSARRRAEAPRATADPATTDMNGRHLATVSAAVGTFCRRCVNECQLAARRLVGCHLFRTARLRSYAAMWRSHRRLRDRVADRVQRDVLDPAKAHAAATHVELAPGGLPRLDEAVMQALVGIGAVEVQRHVVLLAGQRRDRQRLAVVGVRDSARAGRPS